MAEHPKTTASTSEINLIIAVESRMECQLFKDALERSRERLKVVFCAVSQNELSASVLSHHVHIAVVSESLRDGPFTGFQFLNHLRTLSPHTRSIMLLKSDSSDLVVDAFRAGAKGVFFRTESPQRLPKCIRAVHSGHIWANSKQLDRVIESLSSAAPLKLITASPKRPLTKREGDVMKLVVEGFNNRTVAQKLGLTENAVSTYLFNIYKKLGILSRVELVLFSLKRSSY